MRITLIVNPHASRVTAELVERVEAVLRPVETLRTEHKGHAVELAAAAGGEAVVVLSGDGGANEVLNGIRHGVAVGVLPGGGTNVFARALGLPRDPLAAAVRLRTAGTRRISLGRVNGRRFSFSAGLGIDAAAVRKVDAIGRSPDGRRPGDLMFARTLASILTERRFRYEPTLEIAGHGTAALAFVSNCDPYSYAGRFGLRLTPRARFEQGLDVAAPRRVGAISLVAQLARLAAGRGLKGIALHDVDRLEIRCTVPTPLQCDGEDLGDVEHVVFEAERAALDVLV